MKIFDFAQGTPEWHQMRLGKATASNFHKILAKGNGATRKTYMLELASQILTGQAEEIYQNSAMIWGTKTEPQARAMYELESGASVKEVGFIMHNEHVGMSPDGLVGEKGSIEIKCFTSKNQIKTFLSEKMPPEHKPQVQGVLWVSKREWCDFVSFDPRLPDTCSFFCQRIERDEEYIYNLEIEINKFVEELKEVVKRLS